MTGCCMLIMNFCVGLGKFVKTLEFKPYEMIPLLSFNSNALVATDFVCVSTSNHLGTC